MPKKATSTCGATVAVGEDQAVLTCSLDLAADGGPHDGPVHSDHGHAWGDPTLPAPHHQEA